MIAENRIMDLTPYIDADEEWSSMIEPIVQKGCTYTDGNIYLAPISTAAFSCCGIFWNQELFRQAGIDSFPTTWDEFWACCDKLTKDRYHAAGTTYRWNWLGSYVTGKCRSRFFIGRRC